MLRWLTLLRGAIAAGTIRTSVVLGLRAALQAGTLVIVARMLGPDRFGAFAALAALAVLLGTLSTCGTHLVLLGTAANDRSQAPATVAWALPTTLLAGGVLWLLYLGTAATILAATDVGLLPVLAIGAAEILAQPLVNLFSAPRLALGHVARSQMLQWIAPVLRLGAAAAIWQTRVEDPLASYALACWVATAIAACWAWATLPVSWPTWRAWRLPHRAELLHASSYGVLNITKAGPAELDKVLVARFVPLAAAGVYSAAARIVAAATIPVAAMSLTALPRLFRDQPATAAGTNRLTRWLFVAAGLYGIGVAVVLWLLAPWAALLFGAGFHDLAALLRWVCLATPALALRMVAGNVLMAVGKPWARASFELAGLVVLAATAIVLAPRWLAMGMAFALMASEWSMAVLGIGLVWRARARRTTDTTGGVTAP